jgi:tetratricopeptide (TPR) repeat protein
MKSSFAAAFLTGAFLLSVPASAQFHEHRDSRGSLSGRVLSSRGERAVVGARVQLRPLTGGLPDETETNGNGEFSFQGLSSGAYVVTVSAPGSPSLEQSVRVGTANMPLIFRVAGPETAVKAGGATVSVRELKIPEKARKAFEKGMERLAGNDAEGSVVEFERAIAAYPAYDEAYYKLGAAQLDLGRGSEAGEAFRKAIEKSDGHFAGAYFALGLVLCRQGTFAEAETLARTGLTLDPSSVPGEFALAWAEFGLHRLADAEKSAREVLLRRGNFAEAHLLLAEIHRQENNLSALVEDLDAYLKLDGTSARSAQLRTLRESAARSLAQAEKTATVVASAKP